MVHVEWHDITPQIERAISPTAKLISSCKLKRGWFIKSDIALGILIITIITYKDMNEHFMNWSLSVSCNVFLWQISFNLKNQMASFRQELKVVFKVYMGGIARAKVALAIHWKHWKLWHRFSHAMWWIAAVKSLKIGELYWGVKCAKLMVRNLRYSAVLW